MDAIRIARQEPRGQCVPRLEPRNKDIGTLNILQAVRNEAVDFLAIVPSPPQLIFQLYTFSTGERARVRGKEGTVFWFIL